MLTTPRRAPTGATAAATVTRSRRTTLEWQLELDLVPPRSAPVMSAPTTVMVMPAAVMPAVTPDGHWDGYQAADEQDADQRSQHESKGCTHVTSDGALRRPIRRSAEGAAFAPAYSAQQPTLDEIRERPELVGARLIR
jgi:hypothetical protein